MKPTKTKPQTTVVVISANAEWRAIRKILPDENYQTSPFGEWFKTSENQLDKSSVQEEDSHHSNSVIFLHGGWGKIAAAASTQYAIDRWKPDLLMNLGTCGGFDGEVSRGTIILVEKTVVYDIIEQMGDYDEHIQHYTTVIDLNWLKEPYPQEIQRALLVSGDRDLLVEDIPILKSRFQAIAGDWESGAIAYVANRNSTRFLILRGVTDLVGKSGGEAYGNLALFEHATLGIMQTLIDSLPDWLQAAHKTLHSQNNPLDG